MLLPHEDGSKILKQAHWKGRECPACGEQQLQMYVRGHYISSITVPIFPSGKTVGTVCENCNHHIQEHEFPAADRPLIKQLKKTTKYPRHWYGLAFVCGALLVMFLVIVAAVGITSLFSDDNSMEYINQPMVDDIYYFYDETEPSEYKFSLRKVTGVYGDTVRLSPNDYQYDGMPTILEPEDGFYDIYFSYHKNELLELYEYQVIRAIKRGFSKGYGFERELIYPDSLLEN